MRKLGGVLLLILVVTGNNGFANSYTSNQFSGFAIGIAAKNDTTTYSVNKMVNIYSDGSQPDSYLGDSRTDKSSQNTTNGQVNFSYSFVNTMHYYFGLKLFLASQTTKASTQNYSYVFNTDTDTRYYSNLALKNKSSINYGLIFSPGYAMTAHDLVYLNFGIEHPNLSIDIDSHLTNDFEPVSTNVTKSLFAYEMGLGYERRIAQHFSLFAEYDYLTSENVSVMQQDADSSDPDRTESYKISLNNQKILLGAKYYF